MHERRQQHRLWYISCEINVCEVVLAGSDEKQAVRIVAPKAMAMPNRPIEPREFW